ncbi:sigma-70 family RNA polymerase sigma factor [Azospirillum sp. SYSU D00513]|uniref:sigma-70 family RNA polymerase sigma factor n=1 Tax=Azospirillum sp. SYSU D00513 TaxID=2812561 RepID=UPI001A969278|nr:sigma-70 family RNA polymerase sigma factor [Azospirillum sp. SYSU D00513]
MTVSSEDSALDEDELGRALQRCAGGDRAALRKIYEGEAGRMLGVAQRMLRRPALAEEAVHDTFLQVWRHAASFDPARGSARGWLFAILRHRALNILRGEVRTDLVDDFEPMGLLSEEDKPDAMIMRLSENGRLRRCLEKLDPARRDAIVLAYGNGLSHGELAGRIGVPLGTVKSWIRRSLSVLKECMG